MRKLLQIVTLGCFALSSWYMMGTEPSRDVRVEVGKQQKSIKHIRNRARERFVKGENITKSPIADTYHPYYYIKSIGFEGKTICTYDETIWTVSSRDAYIVRNWTKDMPVIIMPNHRWFSKHNYCLKNAVTNEIVPVTISQGPLIRHAIFIKEMSRYGNVTLTNGSKWSVGFFDSRNSTYNSWCAGHAVFIGESGNWLSPYILLNINKNNYLTAKMY